LTVRAFLNNKPLDLPSGFTIPLEQVSPIRDFDKLRIADFSMGIQFPLTGPNRIAFGFADRLDMANKQISYPDFRLETDGKERLVGTLVLEEIVTEAGSGYFDCDFITNLLPYNLNDTKLSDVLTKTINLGATTAAIIAGAVAQNNANMSTDGETGARLKFIPTHAPDFYGDTNEDWNPNPSEYKQDSEYAEDDIVSFRLPEFVNDWNVPNGLLHAHIPRNYLADEAIADSESPFSKAEKWTQFNSAIMNMPQGSSLQGNTSYNFRLNAINRHALLPYIQIHDIFRAIAESWGWTVTGEYMSDVHEQRALFQSSLALDLSSGSPNWAFVGDAATHTFGPGIGAFDAVFAEQDGLYADPNDLWRDNTSQADFAYFPNENGFYIFTIRVRVQNNKSAIRYFRVRILSWDGVGSISTDFEVQEDIAADDLRNLEFQTNLITLDSSRHYWIQYSWPDDVDFEVTLASCEVRNIETDFINVFQGKVHYADHMPDMTVGDFLLAIKTWKNLFFDWDAKDKVLTLDYTENKLRKNTGLQEMSEHITAKRKTMLKAKRRFSMNYGELPDLFEPLFGFTELDPVDSVFDLPAPNQGNRYILVRNEQAYYITKEYDYGGRLFWEFAGHSWERLQVESEGDLMEIKPALGPVSMRRVAHQLGEYLCPYFEGQGRSEMFNPGGSRPPLRVIYWVGYDTSVIAAGVPYGTVTKFNAAGTTVLTKDMLWSSVYEVSWKRTLQMLVLEEITRNFYRLPPEKKQLINFSRIFLLGHVPVMPIKTTEAIGGNGLMEIEARKVKSVEIEVVSETSTQDEGPIFWTPTQVTTELWLDADDSLTLFEINDGTSPISQNDDRVGQWQDKSGNGRHVSQATAGLKPFLKVAELNGKNVVRTYDGGYDTHNGQFLDGSLALDTYSLFLVAKIVEAPTSVTVAYSVGVGGAKGVGWGSSSGNTIYVWAGGNPRLNINNAVQNQAEVLMILNNNPDNIIQGQINGGALVSVNNSAAITSIRIGERADGFWGFPGDIAELVVLNGEVTQDIREKMEGYLAHKWGTVARLDVNHPYKLGAPTI
jgi:hypothetical protein